MSSAWNQSVVILGTGSFAPERVMTNDDLAQLVETSDEWIRPRTGIRERRIAGENETTSDMATEAARKALENAGVAPEEIDLIVVGTCTPDMAFPNVATIVQARLGAKPGPAMDLEAACAGYPYVLDVADALMRRHGHRKALVIGADKMSSILNWNDRTTCVLFGDGAGAVVLGLEEEPGHGLIETKLGADGRDGPILCVPMMPKQAPTWPESLAFAPDTIYMNGREVFKQAVRVMGQSSQELLERNNVTSEEVKLFVPHQANTRIIEAMADRMGVSMDRFIINLDRYGNTSSASIPLALDEANRAGRLQKGDYLLMVAFGGGLTWGATLAKWF
ncbi:MAG: 3-oxoacyl-acyl-carrier-protein synthase III [Puniceicoccaceae bacterium 5H]|nr:MAG: 3-oxoacyl-acyl-carrier-protein synthase III [Puniceicoccaceae bacterium 5H]